MSLYTYAYFLPSIMKGPQCYRMMLKWFVRSCADLFVDLGVSKMSILPFRYNLTKMMEYVFSFLPSYFPIIFLTKGKISKSANLFLQHIGPKQCWPIRLQNFKSNISLEQSNEIFYIFTCWYQELRVDKKYWGWSGHKWLWPPWSQGEWMNGWMNWADFSCWYKFRKVNYCNNFCVTVVKNGHETLISMNGIWLNFSMLIHIKESYELL